MMLCLKLTLLTLLIAAPGLCVSGETVITCDGDVQRLSCDTGVILVTTTVYGRSDSNICSNAPRNLKVTDTSCSSTVSTIADRCNGLRECEVKTNLLGSSNPCKGTYKYYTTTYDCINARDVVVCEHGYRTLDCGADTINIMNANFGRADTVTCSSGVKDDSTHKTNCYAPNTFSTVTSLCNGQHKCTVESSSSVFKDSCKETAKYLTVSYTCLKTVITCDGDVQRLSCDTGVILVTTTVYGRSDSKICSNAPRNFNVTDTSCSSTVSTIADRCNGLRECEVKTNLLGSSNPCKGTYKYYTTTYDCINARDVVVCEHGYRTLDCGNLKIKISSASFGRTDSTTCSSGRPAIQLSNTMCYASNALKIVNDRCNGQSSCQVPASNYVFSDPCGGTYKYLTIVYSCI
ncbi:hypothetical protein Q7C36_012383 [Tachysurus vachellii]|uniref:SUEL-type lectin domain-containing protein n=1 Tax=Tachysurus vachellii TaxID=175792 RepID=A0AA88MPB3_TACVA|nr:hypothetical protein Q7C36_012383 [Tachysurus vachellii]